MIDVTNLVDDFKTGLGLWCPVADDSAELARMADVATHHNVGILSVVPGAVKTLWPWLEGKNIKIFSRFYVAPARILAESVVSELVKNIKTSFTRGASGAQVFVPVRMLGDFAREMRVVRDDLFFNKSLCVGLDICDVGAMDWQSVFDCLIQLRADYLVLVFSRDTGDKSDFVGRVYAMMNAWNAQWNGGVCWMLNDDYYRMEQVMRLGHAIVPDVAKRTVLLVHGVENKCE